MKLNFLVKTDLYSLNTISWVITVLYLGSRPINKMTVVDNKLLNRSASGAKP